MVGCVELKMYSKVMTLFVLKIWLIYKGKTTVTCVIDQCNVCNHGQDNDMYMYKC